MTRSDWLALARHIGLLILVAAVAFMLGQKQASAHDWYPLSCCAQTDCMAVPTEAVRITPNGWQIVATGEVLGWQDHRIRDTPPEGEGMFHWCRHLKDKPATAWSKPIKAGTTICLFVPPGGV